MKPDPCQVPGCKRPAAVHVAVAGRVLIVCVECHRLVAKRPAPQVTR
jgi:hypothetical protein